MDTNHRARTEWGKNKTNVLDTAGLGSLERSSCNKYRISLHKCLIYAISELTECCSSIPIWENCFFVGLEHRNIRNIIYKMLKENTVVKMTIDKVLALSAHYDQKPSKAKGFLST